MQATVVSACLAALLLAGCSGSGSSSSAERKCPVPVHYSKEQYDEIQKALKALPKDSILLEDNAAICAWPGHRQVHDSHLAALGSQ